MLIGRIHRCIEVTQKFSSVLAKTIQGPSTNQGFESLPIDLLAVDTVTKGEKI